MIPLAKNFLKATNILSYKKEIYEHYAKNHIFCNQKIDTKSLEPRKHYIRKLIQRHFPKNKDAKILDLGCGHGAILYFAKEMGYTNLTGIDCSDDQVAIAYEFGLEAIVRKDDMRLFLQKEPNESYDMIISFDTLEHFSKQEIFDFGKRVNKALNKNGVWLIHVPNAEGIFGNRILNSDFTHETNFSHRLLDQVLKTLGFSRASFFEDTPIVHGPKSFFRWFLWKLVLRNLFSLLLLIETGSGKGFFTQNLLCVARK